jgi:hypothetical protein
MDMNRLTNWLSNTSSRDDGTQDDLDEDGKIKNTSSSKERGSDDDGYDFCYDYTVGRDSSVGITTRYVLDDPGIEFRRGRDFPQPSRPVLGSTQTPIKWIPGLFPGGGGGKQPGCAVDHPPSSSARVKERAQLYLYSPSGPLWPVLGRNLPVPL